MTFFFMLFIPSNKEVFTLLSLNSRAVLVTLCKKHGCEQDSSKHTSRKSFFRTAFQYFAASLGFSSPQRL